MLQREANSRAYWVGAHKGLEVNESCLAHGKAHGPLALGVPVVTYTTLGGSMVEFLCEKLLKVGTKPLKPINAFLELGGGLRKRQ